MICQKCKYPHANPLGCLSCGWVHDPNYHPELGAAPVETAMWTLAQPVELLEKLYGVPAATARIAAAQKVMAELPPPPAPPKPVAATGVNSVVVEPVESPNAVK